jgi:CubicO group peptidase (beta-lactamase class C family)
MKHLLLFFLLVFSVHKAQCQTYFPPLVGSQWDTLSPQSLGWCQDSINQLYNWLETSNSKAFIALKDGKIVLEKYFGTFTVDSFHVWNSAGKTLTAYAVGIAQHEGFLDINEPTSNYLGTGWTSCTSPQELAITIRNQLTMTSGLDDVTDFYCTDPACLTYVADAGTRWAYHNGPYTLLDSVIESATGINLNTWVFQKIGSKIGMNGLFVQNGYNNVFVSKPRAMARFGLLLSQNGFWNGTEVLNDPTYLNDMRTPSQNLNNSYGYLTWLNGQSSFMLPQSQFVFNGSICPSAPSDMYAALGKNGQIINVVPSSGIVLIRMGADMGNSLVGAQYNDTLWQYMNRLSCNLSITENLNELEIYPNPSESYIQLEGMKAEDRVLITDLHGKELTLNTSGNRIDCSYWAPGVYLVHINRNGTSVTKRIAIK